VVIISYFIPSINQDYSLDLSILLSEGKETKKDSQSNCEWNGKNNSLNWKNIFNIYYQLIIII